MKTSFYLFLVGIFFIGILPVANAESVPDWVKNTAGWWATDAISEIEFVNAIEFLVKEGIIDVTSSSELKSSEGVPDWVKNTAGWWATDAISEIEFVNAIEFLVKEGIIDVTATCIFNEPEYNHLGRALNEWNNYDTKKLLCFEYELSFLEDFIGPINWKNESIQAKTNDFGFRGDEFSKEKANDTYRIFMLGGSTMYSYQVYDDQTIPVLTEKLIEQEKIPYEIEIINAGIKGAASSQEIKLINEKILNYQPDLIIIYDGWNDIKHAIRNGDWDSDSRWKDNWSNVCNDLKEEVDIIITLQPFLGIGNKILTDQESNNLRNALISRNQSLEITESQDYANHLSELDNKCAGAYDLRYVFDDYLVPFYFDYGHVNYDANKILANNFFKIIMEHLELESNNKTMPQYEINYKYEKILVSSELDFRGKLIVNKDLSNGNFKNAIFHGSEIKNVTFVNSDLTNADFRFAKIENVNFENADLTGAIFAGSEVTKSNFTNSKMNKTYASGGIFKQNYLINAIITDSNWRGTDFGNNIIDGANLSNSDFSKSLIYSLDFSSTNISGAKFSGVKIFNSNLVNLDFTNTIIDGFTEANVPSGTNIKKSNLAGANLSDMNLSSINFSGGSFGSGEIYGGSNLENANLSNSNFKNTLFSGNTSEDIYNVKDYPYFDPEIARGYAVNLSGADLSNSINLHNTNFNFVIFEGTNLTNVDLSYSSFMFANLEGANLEGANLEGANLEGANLNCINHQICN